MIDLGPITQPIADAITTTGERITTDVRRIAGAAAAIGAALAAVAAISLIAIGVILGRVAA